MNLLCLMPTYGRRAELLENTLACFLSQEYPAHQRRLFIFDDLGTLKKTKIPDDSIIVWSRTNRSESIGHKYNEMLDKVKTGKRWRDWDVDAVVVWDDDDLYFPWHLSVVAETLKVHPWCKPSLIWNAYFDPVKLFDPAGGYHGSIAIGRELLEQVGGWIPTKDGTFDQQMMDKLQTFKVGGQFKRVPGDTCTLQSGSLLQTPLVVDPKTPERILQSPSYCYRWSSTNAGHCSGKMDNPNWYDELKPDSTEPIEMLTPRFDIDTIRIRGTLNEIHSKVVRTAK